jgi:hypothetical protein
MKNKMGKFSRSLLVVLFLQAALSGCNHDNPKEVAKSWLTSFYRMDYDAAKKLSTDDAKNMLSTFEILSPDLTDSFKKDLKRIEITVKDVKVSGDTAAVATYVMSDMPGKEDKLNLVKQGGRWLVQYSKSDNRPVVDTTLFNEPDSTQTTGTPADTTMTIKGQK